MNRITAIIVDDERLARTTLKNKLSKFSFIEIIGESDSCEDAIQKIEAKQPDLLFLDIQLYNKSGFDVLDNVSFNGKVIFVTAHDQFAIRAFEVNAIDYLLKPISHERLEQALSKINQKEIVQSKLKPFEYSDKVLVSQQNGMKFIDIANIVSIQSNGDYSEVVDTDNKKYLIHRTLDEWDNRLPNNYFIRIHRSTIININKVRKIEKWVNYSYLVYMSDLEEPFKLSRTYLKKFKERFL